MGELLTSEERQVVYGKVGVLPYKRVLDAYLEAQVGKVLSSFRNAQEQSRKGGPIDLPEEAFELFSAIQNDAIGKAEEIKKQIGEYLCTLETLAQFHKARMALREGRMPVEEE